MWWGGNRILLRHIIPHKPQMNYLSLKSGTFGSHPARHLNMNGAWKEACRINHQSHAPQSAVTGRRMTTCNLTL